MSSIAGVYYFDQQPVSTGLLETMNCVMAHRSPDGRSIWASDKVGLAHGMLWSTPESLCEKLPLVRSAFVLTSDARIDNRDELMDVLRIDRTDPSKISDSEFILAAYDKWGEDCPEHLLGDFAFAIWDEPKQQLFCARDPMGVKPFVYTRSQKLFAFASEIKALFCLTEVSRNINELRIGQLLMRDIDDPETTVYQDIWRLPAAYCLTIAPGTFRLRQYWKLDSVTELKLDSDYEYAKAYREIFEKAVRVRMRTAFPIGSMLSGGMDSSSIACVARNLLGETSQTKLHTFSTRFESLPEERKRLIDETFYVEKVLETGGFTPHFIDGDQLNPLGDYDRMFHHIDEPFVAPNIYYNWEWYKVANRNQVRILLDGIDGDSTVSHGQFYLAELIHQNQWVLFLKEIRRYSRLTGLSTVSLLWQWGIQSLIPDRLWRILDQQEEHWCPRWKQSGIHADFAKEFNLSKYCHHKITDCYHDAPIRSARALHCLSLHSGLIQYALELADRVSAAWQVELRYPYCDRRLMEFCVSLPADQKFKGGWTRLIARRAMQGLLPEEIRLRLNKANLGINTKPSLLHHERDRIENNLFQINTLQNRYIDIQRVTSIYRKFCDNPLHERDALAIYGMTTLGLWLDSDR